MLDLQKHGIKVSTIMPGSVSTYFNNHQPNENDAWKIQSEDIGQLVVDLLKMNPRTLPSKIEVRPTCHQLNKLGGLLSIFLRSLFNFTAIFK